MHNHPMLGHGATVLGTLGFIATGVEWLDKALHPILPLLSSVALVLGIVVHLRELRKK
jgi:hypothetical protein